MDRTRVSCPRLSSRATRTGWERYYPSDQPTTRRGGGLGIDQRRTPVAVSTSRKDLRAILAGERTTLMASIFDPDLGTHCAGFAVRCGPDGRIARGDGRPRRAGPHRAHADRTGRAGAALRARFHRSARGRRRSWLWQCAQRDAHDRRAGSCRRFCRLDRRYAAPARVRIGRRRAAPVPRRGCRQDAGRGRRTRRFGPDRPGPHQCRRDFRVSTTRSRG